MLTRPFRAALAACVTLAAGTILQAATPVFWQVATQADFLKGEIVENLSIDDDGRLILGPSVTLVHESDAPFIWALEPDTDGSLLVGTGNDGKVLRIDASGKASVLFDAEELEAHAIARGPGGSVYVGTSPEGKVYKVSRDGTATPFFDPGDKYLWALAVSPDGTVYVGTGEKGVVYRVGPDGEGKPFYRTKATHVTALAFDKNGELLIGTESPGQVLRVDKSGKAFVVLDSPYREVHSLRVGGTGEIYAVAVSGRPGPEQRPQERTTPEPTAPTPTASVSTEITITAIGDVSVPASTATPAARTETRREARGAVYRIAADGLWDTLWQSNEDSPFDVAIGSGQTAFVGTGNKGKVFSVGGDPTRTALVARASAQQVTMIARAPNGSLYFATANPGKVYRLALTGGARGVYESDVRDAGTVATWGTIRWRATIPAGSSVEVATRSGNTSTPDDTWSEWSKPYGDSNGDEIVSPKARYLQWRATLAGKGTAPSPVLTSVTVAYLPRNSRPVVENITVHPPGVVFQRPFSTGEQELAGFDLQPADARAAAAAAVAGGQQAPALGRRTFQKGLQTFVWKAVDENDDRLQYDVSYRREGETGWRVLRRGLTDAILTWDTTSVPDGTYTIKVSASDASSSSPATALAGDLESTSFDIDNTPPVVTIGPSRVEGGATIATFTVRDGQSPIQKVEYSLDASRWRGVFPRDGLADSREETYDLELPGGETQAIVRASDALGNVATAVVTKRP